MRSKLAILILSAVIGVVTGSMGGVEGAVGGFLAVAIASGIGFNMGTEFIIGERKKIRKGRPDVR